MHGELASKIRPVINLCRPFKRNQDKKKRKTEKSVYFCLIVSNRVFG